MSKRKPNFNLLTGFEPGAKTDEYARNYTYYKNIALNVYQWEGLPNGLESRHIEKALYEKGEAFFFDDELLGFMCLPSSGTNNLNVYGDPTSVMVTGHGFYKQLNIKNGVRILNNDSGTATHAHVDHYSRKLAETESLMDQNLTQQRFPYFLKATKSTEFSLKAMFKRMMSGETGIIVNKDHVSGDSIEVMNTEVPYLLDRLQAQLECYRKELLTFLGINSSIEKKERLLVDEVNSNNDYINMSLDLGLKQRQLAADKINELFGLNIKVTATVDDFKEEEFNQLSVHEEQGKEVD